MFEIIKRKVTHKSLDRRLNGLGSDTRWLFKAKQLLNEDYHTAKGLSSSIVKEISDEKKSDYYIHQKYIAKTIPREEKAAYVIGSALHKIVLEPKEFDDEFIVSPKFDKRTKAGKEEFALFQEKAKGKQIINVSDLELIKEMKAAIWRNDEAREAIKNSLPEVSVFWRDEVTNIICKARADALSDDCVYDVKTVLEVSPIAFLRDVVKFQYHVQAAFYMSGFCMEKFRFICVNKTPPFECAVYELDEEFIEVAHLLTRDAIDRFNDCIEKNQWDSFTNETTPVKTLNCPRYLAARILGM